MRFLPIVTTAIVVAFIGTSAMAQTATAPATIAPATTMKPATGTMTKPKAMTTAQTDVSKACSTQADAKGLHGKERSKFRSECKKNGAKM